MNTYSVEFPLTPGRHGITLQPGLAAVLCVAPHYDPAKRLGRLVFTRMGLPEGEPGKVTVIVSSLDSAMESGAQPLVFVGTVAAADEPLEPYLIFVETPPSAAETKQGT